MVNPRPDNVSLTVLRVSDLTPEEQRAVEELMARERALMRDGEGEAPEPAGDEHPPI